jgi:hypothetical protein
MIRCPACGAENRPSTKFCAECGASLAAPAAAAPTPADDRTVLLPPQPARGPGTIEQAMRAAPEARRPGERPPPTPSDNDMTVILPKKSAPPPKYEPAPPTVTGPLTEPVPHGKSSRSGSRTSAESPAVAKPKTPIAVVLALVAVAGGSAGYLGWLVLKKNTAPAEKVAVAPAPVEAVKPPPANVAAAIQPAPPAPPPPAAPATSVASVSAAAVVATPPEPPAASPAPPAAAVKPLNAPAVPPAEPPKVKATKVEAAKPEPVKAEAAKAEPPKAEPTKAEKAKAEQAKKDQARLEAAKREKKQAAAQQGAAKEQTRQAEAPRPPAAAAEPARQEPTPLALLRDELRACDAQSIFSRENCKNQARQRRCAGLWDRIPECPYKKELY